MRLSRIAVPLTALLLATSCTILRVDSKGSPPRIESDGLISAHAAVGIPTESHVLHVDLFDGNSPGAIGQIVIWKLFRLEVGVAGAAVSLGPLHLGLGVLAYDPKVPSTTQGRRKKDARKYEDAQDADEAFEEIEEVEGADEVVEAP